MEDDQMTTEEYQSLVETLEATPRIIQQLADDLADGDATWKPSEKQWSVLEHVCHLKDIEQEGYTLRIEKLLRETQPFLADIDGDKLAEERSYHSQDFDQALSAFARARKQNVQTIKDLTHDQLNRSGMFENFGTVTLARLLLMMREHDESHLKDLSGLHERIRRERSQLSATS